MIKSNKLSFCYNTNSPLILDNINLDIKKGEYVSILGDNGSGKSTLIKLILGFLNPTNGNLKINTKKIGYVPQRKEFSNSDFPITVFELLNSYRKLLKIKDKNIVKKSLNQVGMLNFSNSLFGTLSGGQSQKILIARSLIGNPELLILDEPSTGIDISSQKEIYDFIKKTCVNDALTIVSVEHNLSAAIANSTSIFHLIDGKGHFCTPENYASEFLSISGKDEYIV